MNIEKGLYVQTSTFVDLTDKTLPEVFVRSRKNGAQGIVDSPVYTTLNKLWLVHHDTSSLVRGISVGRYGIYHENELTIVELPPDESHPEDNQWDELSLD